MTTLVQPSRRRGTRRRRRDSPGVLVILSFIVLALVAVAIAFSGVLVPNATTQDILSGSLPAGSAGHLLGTDELGRDILQLTIAGTASAVVGPVVIAVGSMLIGVLFGALAGFLRGSTDWVVGRATDVLLALPVMLVALVVAGILGSGYWVTVGMLVVLFSPSDVRIVRSGVMEQAPRPYVEAAQMLSLSRPRIMFRHIVPNVLPLILTNMLLNIAFALVTLSSLSYLGVGVQAGTADWGRQIADGRSIMFANPAAIIVPAVCIIAVACAINIVGDWLGDRFQNRGVE